MLCQYCNQREGVEKLVIRGGMREKVCVCRECEAAQLRAQFAAKPAPAAAPMSEPALRREYRCPKCGRTSAEFEESKLLGCPYCYEAMAPLTESILRRAQPSSVHVGKSPDGGKRASEYERLRGELDRAVKEERYEDAAAYKRMLDGLKGGRPC